MVESILSIIHVFYYLRWLFYLTNELDPSSTGDAIMRF